MKIDNPKPERKIISLLIIGLMIYIGCVIGLADKSISSNTITITDSISSRIYYSNPNYSFSEISIKNRSSTIDYVVITLSLQNENLMKILSDNVIISERLVSKGWYNETIHLNVNFQDFHKLSVQFTNKPIQNYFPVEINYSYQKTEWIYE